MVKKALLKHEEAKLDEANVRNDDPVSVRAGRKGTSGQGCATASGAIQRHLRAASSPIVQFLFCFS